MKKNVGILDLEQPFKLFENCVIVKGYTRSIIVDLGRKTYYFIPNDLGNIISDFDGKCIREVITHFKPYNASTVKKYFLFLLDKEIIFFTTTPLLFPKIDLTKWSEPSKIYQSIIDIGDNINFLDQSVFNSLDKLNCKYLELRIYKDISFEALCDLLEKIENLSIIGVNLYVRFTVNNLEKEILKITKRYSRINNVFIFNSPFNKQIGFTGKNCSANIYFIIQNIKGCSDCGLVSQNYFAINIKAVTEAINHNSCLNRKLSIDIHGNIKNCPSMKDSFGNIKNTRLEDALVKKGFKKYWDISKDKIKICQDCEFRYICTDCRAYTEDPNDVFSKPLKCGYDPYTGKWKKWSKNPLKQKAIEYYGLDY